MTLTGDPSNIVGHAHGFSMFSKTIVFLTKTHARKLGGLGLRSTREWAPAGARASPSSPRRKTTTRRGCVDVSTWELLKIVVS